MKLRHKISAGFLIVLTVAIASLAVVLSHTSACGPAPVVSADAALMKAVVYRCYGPPDVLVLEDIEKPTPADDEGLGTPANVSMGADFAGRIEAVGSQVTKFKPGDEVFGARSGAFGEYVTVRDSRAVVLKPANVTFEQAAAVPVAAITALQALRDKGQVKPGQRVLINGASGGVGTFAVQIAKSLGAEVTGVCSTRNIELVRSLGADHVFDYKREDYTESGQQYDLIVDMVGNHTARRNLRVLKPDGTLVLVGGPKGNWIAPLIRPIGAMILSPFVDQELITLLAQLNQEDLLFLGELMAAGKLTPVIDRRFPLSEVPAAIRYSEAGRARGKIIIGVD
jgi:NADPH:quinone reductase-like Zn-dependent oxidoreductase